MDFISSYQPRNQQEMKRILGGVVAMLQHRSPCVVMSAISVISNQLPSISNEQVRRQFCMRAAPSLISLLSSETEIQYVTLKTVSMILQLDIPIIDEEDMREFFVNVSDQLYIKREKLEILCLMADDSNVDIILNEIREYVSAVDIDFIQLCVALIGRLALKLPESSNKCVQALSDCLAQKSG